jgi:hypothetical protein
MSDDVSRDSPHAGLPTGMPEPAPGDTVHPSAHDAGPGAARITPEMRERLSRLADQLIPEIDQMPSASSVDIAYGQLDDVLRSRPDLGAHLREALSGPEAEDALKWLESLVGEDREGVTLAIVAAYYMHPRVKELLGYPGQQAIGVSVGGFPEYVSEGILDSVVDRGPIYRSPPED